MAGLLALTSPPPDFLFSSIHQNPTIPPKARNIPYWYCLQCTPSLTLPPSSLKCLQNYHPNIHRKCFRCFGCFRCFISLLDHKTARFWSKSEQTRQTDRVVSAPYYGYGKHPKRQSTHLWGAHPHLPASPHTICLANYSRSYFFGGGGFILVARHKSGQAYPFLNERAVSVGGFFLFFCSLGKLCLSLW